MNYDEMSDFEINLAVAKGLGLVVSRESHGHSAVEARGDDGYHVWFTIDYCSNPADMWPLMIENGISLVKLKNGYQAVSSNWNYMDITSYDDDINDCGIGGDEVHQYGDKNPLRAAAIVFLMMQESK